MQTLPGNDSDCWARRSIFSGQNMCTIFKLHSYRKYIKTEATVTGTSSWRRLRREGGRVVKEKMTSWIYRWRRGEGGGGGVRRCLKKIKWK